MKKRVSLYVEPKHPALWIMALCMLASVIVRIAVFAPLENVGVWQQIVLPVAASVLFVLLAFLAGKEMLYKTATAIWLLGVCKVWRLTALWQETPLLCCLACAGVLLFCVVYTVVISGKGKIWLTSLFYAIALGVAGFIHMQIGADGLPAQTVFYVLPDYLLFVGLFAMLFALKVHNDGKYHPTWGDRAEGRRIRSIPAIDQIVPYIMVDRTGANNLFSTSVEITELEQYIRGKSREGLKGFGMMHVIIAAYVRTVAKFPALNRFIAGQRVYTRGEDIALSMTVKKEMKLSSPDTVIKVHFNPKDTVYDVYNKWNEQVQVVKNTPLESDLDNTVGLLSLVPGIVLKLVVWLLRVLDYFGQIPQFLLEVSPFHGSAYFTSMGSLGIQPVYHHLYDFGTVPVFCSFGRKRRAEEIKNGEIIVRKYVDLKFNLDERICDGFYYAAVIKYFLRLMSHPEELDLPPEVVEQDIP